MVRIPIFLNHCRSEAAVSCTDMPLTVRAGLAMWLPRTVFEWVHNSSFKDDWMWVGLHGNVTTSPYTDVPQDDKDTLWFGQGPTIDDPRY